MHTYTRDQRMELLNFSKVQRVNEEDAWGNNSFLISSHIGGSYLVFADNMGDALDIWALWAYDQGYKGLVTKDPVGEGWVTEEEFEDEQFPRVVPADLGIYYMPEELHVLQLR
jgi:hypothetical protein